MFNYHKNINGKLGKEVNAAKERLEKELYIGWTITFIIKLRRLKIM